MDRLRALNTFWNSFTWAAYDENTVPDGALEANGWKYITYEAAFSGFDESVALTASLWQRSDSWAEISQKALEINDYIGLGGKLLKFDDGILWITRGQPFAQRMGDPNDTIRRYYLNITAEFMSAERS